jgi:hypothetical protein
LKIGIQQLGLAKTRRANRHQRHEVGEQHWICDVNSPTTRPQKVAGRPTTVT